MLQGLKKSRCVHRNGRERHLHIGRARHEGRQRVRSRRERLPRLQRRAHHIARRHPGRTCLDRIGPRDGVVARTRQIERDVRDTLSRSREGRAQILTLATLKRRVERTRRSPHRRRRLDGRIVTSRLPLDIVDGQRRRDGVSRRKEARQRHQSRNRIAHGHRLRSRTDARVRPRHRHHAQLAVERRHIERDGRLAAADLHRRRRQHDGLGRHDGQTRPADLVAALPHIARSALVRIEQAAIIIAQLNAQAALAEEIGRRIGRRMARQRQNALVHRQHLHERAFGRTRRGDIDGHLRIRPLHLRRRDIELERPRRHIDSDMAHPHRPARLRRLHGIARRIDRRHDVDARAPLARDRQLHVDALVGLNLDAARRDHVLGCNHDLRLARIGRHDRDIDVLADGRHLVRDLHAHAIGRLDAILRLTAPAGPEAVGGFTAIGFFRQIDFKIAIIQRARLQRALLAFGDVEASGLQFDDPARLAPLPCAAAFAIPVILPVDPHEAPIDVGGLERAGPVDRHHLKACRLALLGRTVIERRLQADIASLRPVSDAQVVTNRAPARFDGREHGPQAQRTAGIAILRRTRIEREHSAALRVRRRRGEIESRFTELLVMAAECKACEFRERVRIGLDAHIAFHRQISARRTVIEAHIRRDRARLARTHRRSRVGLQLQLDALRNKVLDRERLRADDANAVDLRCNAPRPARRRLRHGEGKRNGAVIRFRILEARALGLQPVRTVDHHRSRAIVQRDRRRIADESRDLHRLARTINAALGIDERIRRLGGRPAADIPLGQIDRRAIEIEDRKIAIGRIRHQDAGRDIAFPAHNRPGEVHPAGPVAVAPRQHFIVARHQFQLHARNRPGRLQRPNRRQHPVRARIGRNGKVGNNEPALGPRRPVRHVPRRIDLVEFHEIGPRLQARDRRRDRKHRRRRRVGRSRRIDLAGPQLLGDVVHVRIVVHIAPAARAVRIALADRLEGKRPVRNPRDGDLHLLDIDRLQREPVRIDARQDHAIALEADIGRAVAERDRHALVKRQRAAIRRGQARPDADLAVLSEIEAAEAEIGAIRRQGDLRPGPHVHIGPVIRRRAQRRGEGQACARQVARHVDRVANELELARPGGAAGAALPRLHLRALVLPLDAGGLVRVAARRAASLKRESSKRDGGGVFERAPNLVRPHDVPPQVPKPALYRCAITLT